MKNEMIKKYTNKSRKLKMAPDNRFITVYINGRMNGFIWNNNNVIRVDGDEVVSADFFK